MAQSQKWEKVEQILDKDQKFTFELVDLVLKIFLSKNCI